MGKIIYIITINTEYKKKFLNERACRDIKTEKAPKQDLDGTGTLVNKLN